MDNKKSQHYNFCYDAIPIMFHSQTSEFMKYLQRDGLKFLEFWWNYVGKQLPVEKLVPFEGIEYEVTSLSPKEKMVIIKLPPPKEEDEMYYMGLYSKPERRFAWVKFPSTRVICLVRRSRFPYGTEIGDLTPRTIFVTQGAGAEPTQEAFKRKAVELVSRKSK